MKLACHKRLKLNRSVKTGLIVLVLFLFIFALSPGVAAAVERTYGDINGDGTLNVEDVVLAMRYVLGMETLEAGQLELADVTAGGAVNVQDVTLIIQRVLNLADKFPAEDVTTETYIIVEPNHEMVAGYNWVPGLTVTLTVDGESFSVVPDSEGAFEMASWEYQGMEIKRGGAVTATDGITTKVHYVRDLHITGIDTAADTVSGTAPAGSVVEVRVFDTERDYSDFPLRVVTAAANGSWTADFSQVVGVELQDSAFNIEMDVTGEARISDLTNDATGLYWQAAEAILEAYPEDDAVTGSGWAANAVITVTVGSDSYPATADSHGFFEVDTGELSAGDVVAVTDGVATKSHVITALQVTVADRSTGVIAGEAEPGSTVFIQLLEPQVDQPGPPTLVDEAELTTAAGGSWSVDFDRVIGDEIHIFIMQSDDDGDRTIIMR